MHLYNAWLPPPVAEETKKELESFSRVVVSFRESHRPGDHDSVYSTLKWIPVIDLYVYCLVIVTIVLFAVAEFDFYIYMLNLGIFFDHGDSHVGVFEKEEFRNPV